MDMGHGHASHPGADHPDPPGGHGMAVIGTEAIYLSHLPMFMRPHDYQVILEASFGPADTAYRQDRKKHPTTKLYTFAPQPFVLPDLFLADGALTSFTGTLVRNHFEQPEAHPEKPAVVADKVTVDVTRVVHHHRFEAAAKRPKQLAYLLFGRSDELFVAHLISKPPDFDQLVAVEVDGHQFSDEDLAQGVVLSIPNRPDEPDNRLQEGQHASGAARVDGKDVPIEVTVRTELYFETNDLARQM